MDTGMTLSKLSPELKDTALLASFYNKDLKHFHHHSTDDIPIFFNKKDLEELFLLEGIERQLHRLHTDDKNQNKNRTGATGSPIDIPMAQACIEKLRKKELNFDEFITDISGGYGLKFFSAHRFSKILKTFAHELFLLFERGVNINIYIMTGGEEKKGYDLHTDVGAYFIKQISGVKEWYFPLGEEGQVLTDYQGAFKNHRKSEDFKKGIKSYKTFILKEGDCLHFPLGYPHYAVSRSQDLAVHLTVAIHEYRAVDFVNFASEYMLQNRLKRQPFQYIDKNSWKLFFEESDEKQKQDFEEQWNEYLFSKGLSVLKKGYL